MKYGRIILLSAYFLGLVFVSQSAATVEWDVEKTLKLEKSPLDVAVSAGGKWVFVLTDEGSVLIYSPEGELKGTMAVGKHVDGIKPGPKEDILFLTSKKNKTVEQIIVDFIYNIDVSGSPFRGAETAPVVIVVFNDYQ